MSKLPRIPSADKRGGGATSRAPIDDVFQFSKVVSSSIADGGSVEYNLAGAGGFDLEILPNGQGAKVTVATTDEEGETMQGAEVFGSLGMVGRPLPPQEIDGNPEHLEVLCIREQDGLVPIAARDIRLKMGDVAPGEGVLAFVGYGGGFHSLTPVEAGSTPDGGGTIHVLYCPYDFDADGVAGKAHSIILDPTEGNESIIIAHADGMAITMDAADKKALLLKNAAGDATLRLDDDGITLTATTITLSGGVIVGDPLTASPLLPGAASQGSSKFFLSI